MNLLLAYYGDDFTGSTDVMEALQWAGLRTVLFLDPPSAKQLARFENLRAFGIAGWSRTMSRSEMESALPPIFNALRASGAPFVHYKICSTFDSSPEIGSIGKALELGREIFGQNTVPVLVGAPVLGRYTVFGNHFARSGLDTDPYRLDRHPTMRHHPITPIDEGDLRLLLASQTPLQSALYDVLHLEDPEPEKRMEELLANKPAALFFDVLNSAHLPTIGRMIDYMNRSTLPLFVIGSSGIEYALVAHWAKSDHISDISRGSPFPAKIKPVENLFVITGSCSPANDRQIENALQHGFVGVALDTARLIHPSTGRNEMQRIIRECQELADRGANIIVHSSRGPNDVRIAKTLQQYRELGFDEFDLKLKNGRTLSPKLGLILKEVLARTKYTRVVVTGGDTSGFVARELGIEALEAIAPVSPGSPLCRVHASSQLNGLEILFKGGQVGHPDIYTTILKGTA